MDSDRRHAARMLVGARLDLRDARVTLARLVVGSREHRLMRDVVTRLEVNIAQLRGKGAQKVTR